MILQNDFDIALKTNMSMREIRKFANTRGITCTTYCKVLLELHDDPISFIDEIDEGGEVGYEFAPRVMQRMLDLDNEML